MTSSRRQMKSRGAMTLLELLVAVTILASLTTLAASMWGQMRSWVEDNRAITGALHVDRVGRFLEQRWNQRSQVVRLDASDSSGVWIDAHRIEFVSVDPALFPEWPLVRSRILIRPAAENEEDDRYDLVYEETRLSGADVIDEEQRENFTDPKRITLIENSRDLAVDRYDSSDRREGEQPWRPASAVPADMTREELRRAIDRGLIEKQETPRAVRIRGIANGDEFEWVFIVRDSR